MEWTKNLVVERMIEAEKNIDKLTIGNYRDYKKGKNGYPHYSKIKKYFGNWNNMKREIFSDAEVFRVSRRSWDAEKDLDYIIDIVEEAKKEGLQSYKDIKKFAKDKGKKFPAPDTFSKNWGRWSKFKEKHFGDVSRTGFEVKSEFCRICDIGRCRFDYNLDDCEYYEGESI